MAWGGEGGRQVDLGFLCVSRLAERLGVLGECVSWRLGACGGWRMKREENAAAGCKGESGGWVWVTCVGGGGGRAEEGGEFRKACPGGDGGWRPAWGGWGRAGPGGVGSVA